MNMFLTFGSIGHYYNSGGELMLDELPKHYAIYECSPRCACTALGKCTNNVTQRGFTTRSSIRWTGDRGFGLFAEQDIPKGSFLCCYIGEVISTSETTKRWINQKEAEQSNYILVLKEYSTINGKRQILRTTIDARQKGNVGHFLSKRHMFSPPLHKRHH